MRSRLLTFLFFLITFSCTEQRQENINSSRIEMIQTLDFVIQNEGSMSFRFSISGENYCLNIIDDETESPILFASLVLDMNFFEVDPEQDTKAFCIEIIEQIKNTCDTSSKVSVGKGDHWLFTLVREGQVVGTFKVLKRYVPSQGS